MAPSWADTERSDKYCSQRPEEQKTISIIQDLLDKSITSKSAAHAIAATYEPRLQKGDKISCRPFSLLSHAIIHPTTASEDHHNIAELLIHLSKLPDIIVDGKPLEENGRTYWRSIPEFSFWFTETALNVWTIENLDLGQCPITWHEQAQQYKYANTFAAIYTSALDPSITQEWTSVQCIARDTLMQALEVDILSHPQIRRTGIYIPAAAAWMVHAGSQLWEFCKSRQLCEGKVWREWIGGSDGSKPLWTGDDGFSVERWAFWKARFGDVAGLRQREFAGRVVDDVVMCARMAVKAMHEVEQEDAFSLDTLSKVFEGSEGSGPRGAWGGRMQRVVVAMRGRDCGRISGGGGSSTHSHVDA